MYSMSNKSKDSNPSRNNSDQRYPKQPTAEVDPVLNNVATLTDSERSGEKDKFNRLGWKRLTVCLIVEAIALGALSIPKAFAIVGMFWGVILTVGLGLLSIYTSYVVGQVKMRHEHVEHYADAVRLIWGRFGYELTGAMFVMLLTLVVGSHTLTGKIAFATISDSRGVCALLWSLLAAIILFLCAVPPTFADFAWLGYVDFASIILAILITIIATGYDAHHAVGGLAAVNWSWWPAPDVAFYEAFLAVTNIIFAYCFCVCQYSFMAEMHTPKHYVKSIWALGLIEIVIYTLTGALIYAFVGADVESLALLSASSTVARVAFGVALPVIFISGSINTIVVGRYIMGRAFKDSDIRHVNTRKGWMVWLGLIAAITTVAWLVAQAIPLFNALLGLIASLFDSAFCYYYPALFWFRLVKEGKWYEGRKNIALSMLNGLIFAIGLFTLCKLHMIVRCQS